MIGDGQSRIHDNRKLLFFSFIFFWFGFRKKYPCDQFWIGFSEICSLIYRGVARHGPTWKPRSYIEIIFFVKKYALDKIWFPRRAYLKTKVGDAPTYRDVCTLWSLIIDLSLLWKIEYAHNGSHRRRLVALHGCDLWGFFSCNGWTTLGYENVVKYFVTNPSFENIEDITMQTEGRKHHF